MKKRIVTIALVIALLCTCFAGTYAYLTDTDAATNVMTLGNVDIEQLEFERDADGNLVTFSQDKRLYPAVNPSMEWSSEAVDFPTNVENAARGSQLMFVEPNAQDKFVFVKNTSTLGSEAFVRTLIALEAGSKTEAEIDELIGISYHDKTWTLGKQVYTKIDGKNYVVLEMVYTGRADDDDKNGVLPAGETTTASLCQIYLASFATNADVNALDGNGNNKYDVIVLSQAVQTEGFTNPQTALDTAFGVVTEAKATEWFEAID